MKKNLFLTCALALFAVVGVSAQTWCRTVVNGLPGTEVTHDVDGSSVTQYRAETALIKNAGATGVRYTVVQTTATGAYGGGPFFAMAEMIVLNADNDTISYTVTSNADHNSGGAGKDGAGLPALNDGNLNNFFHSSWGGTEPGGLHYLELTFAEPVDEFKLVWYTRPNQHVNRPQVVGLTNPGVAFTSDMLYSEYAFELGEQVTTAAEIANGGTFTFYVDGPDDLSSYGDYVANGNTFVALSGYTTGSYPEAEPTNIIQIIPGLDGKFIIYQPVLGTYFGNPDRWQDGYNGKNGWLRSYSEAWTLGQFDITPKGNTGEFEITTEITRQYVDGQWVNYATPLKVYVGYDPRGNLKIFPEAVKVGLEQGDYTQGFGLPVDFGFQINRASVADGVIEPMTLTGLCEGFVKKSIATANDVMVKYADIAEGGYDWYDILVGLEDAIDAANDAVANADLLAAYEAKASIETATVAYVGQKINYYFEICDELWAKTEDYVNPPYNQSQTGRYTVQSRALVQQFEDLANEVYEWFDTEGMPIGSVTVASLESAYARLEALVAEIEASRLHFSTFPEIVEDIAADNFSTEYPNNAVWRQSVTLDQDVDGIRLTFLDRHIGTAGDGGNFPMIALGEFVLFDAEGNVVELTEDNFYANHTETQEGFESTVARLCDGNYGAQGYYHSPWSGNEPQEYIYLDVQFPESMAGFTFEVYSRDKSTSQGAVSLFPKKVAITVVGEAYDPLLFEPNPYNVYVGEKVTSVDQITADGLYVIKGLLNTQDVTVTEDGEYFETAEATGTARFYHGLAPFHASSAAVRADGVYRFVPTNGGFQVLSLGEGKFWPRTEENGFSTATYDVAEAANVTIVPSTNVEGAFVMYEVHEGLTTGGDSIDTDADDVYDAISEIVATPYVVYMDWYSGLATRPVTNPQPYKAANVADAWGDSLCFNKANGEGEWEIYKVTMDNPDFFYLTQLTGAFDELGLIVGTNPGEVGNLGNLESVLATGQQVVADSAYADAPAAAAALAKEISAVNSIEKNPMAPGVYQVVSANADFFAKQQKTMALYATVDEAGTSTFGWKELVEGDIQYYFEFLPSENAADLVAGGVVAKEEQALVYTIRAIATYEGETPYYVSEAIAKSEEILLGPDAPSDYLVLNAAGSSFNLSLAGKHKAGFSLHANGHSGGTGTGSNIVYWDGTAGASQWYLRKVDFDTTSIEDLVVEGTEVVSEAYFTPAGAAIPAPEKGINIVVTVYANGVVETKKVLVK